jgi:hypothetical protein
MRIFKHKEKQQAILCGDNSENWHILIQYSRHEGVSIDKELAESLILDISESNGNNLTKDIAINVIKVL